MIQEEGPSGFECTVISKVQSLLIEGVEVLGTHHGASSATTSIRHGCHPLQECLRIVFELVLQGVPSFPASTFPSRWHLSHHWAHIRLLRRLPCGLGVHGQSAAHSHHHLFWCHIVDILLPDVDLEVVTLALLHLMVHILHLLSLLRGEPC